MVAKKGRAELSAALADWPACNGFLREASEGDAKALLELERQGKRRVQFLLRAHARFNRERARRERSELLSSTGG